MIDWLDIVSPRLREIHQGWSTFRHNKLVPDVGAYNEFSINIPQQNLISVIVPKARADAYFRYVGSFGQRVVPKAEAKLKLEAIVPMPERITTAAPFYRAIRSGQPYARRSEYQRGDVKRRFEQLVLPFSDRSGRICLVDAVYVGLDG